MNVKWFVFTVLLTLTLGIKGQNIMPVLAGSIHGVESQTITLSLYKGDNLIPLDSVKCDGLGNFLFTPVPGTPAGLYNVAYGKAFSDQTQNYQLQSFDIIYNSENIRFETQAASPIDSMKVRESGENKQWYIYLKQKAMYQQRCDMLQTMRTYYPLQNEFYKTIDTENLNAQREFIHFYDSTKAVHPHWLATRLMSLDIPAVPTVVLLQDKMTEFNQQHYWDKVDFTDTLLLNSNLFAKKVIGWFGLFNKLNWDKVRVETEYAKATEILMNKAKITPAFFDFCMMYLFDGFERIGFSMALCKLATFMTDESCSERQFSDYFGEQLNSYTSFGLGKQVPDINFNNTDGTTFNLGDIKSEYTLLLFWGSWCPHCEALLPKIRDLYNFGTTRQKLEILAFAIDTSRTGFYEAIEKNHYNWINTTDLKGWESPIVLQYHLYATPTMFIIDKNRTVISRPTNFDQLIRKVKTLIKQ